MPDPENKDQEGQDAVPTPEEIKTLREQAARAQTLEEENNKLKSKDHNFEALRRKQLADIELTAEEKEQLLGEDLRKIREQQEELVKTQYERTVATYLRQFGGNTDEEGRKKIMLQYERLSKADNPKTDDDIFNIMKDAVRLAGVDNVPTIDPINAAATHYAGSSVNTTKKSFTETEDGKRFAKSLGFDPDLYEQAKKEGKI